MYGRNLKDDIQSSYSNKTFQDHLRPLLVAVKKIKIVYNLAKLLLF